MKILALLCFSVLVTPGWSQEIVRPISNDEFAQHETSVAVSRTDPNIIVIGSNDDASDVRSMPAYVTTDGGKSWDTYRLPKAPSSYKAIGDPVVIADNDGGFYYAYLLHNPPSDYNILVAHSRDGKSWTYNAPVIPQSTNAFEDKEWLALDRSPASPTYGRLYVTWTRLHPGIHSESGTFISWSDDTGKTWSPAKRIASFVGTYTLVEIGNAGEIYVTYSQFSEQLDSIGHFLSVSHDFGQTFIERRIASFINYPFDLGMLKSTLKGGRLISFPYTTFALDRKRGVLHAVYGSFDITTEAATQLYIYSTDDGARWSAPHMIGDLETLDRDRFQPWITFDTARDQAHILYYSSEQDPKNLLTAFYWTQISGDVVLIKSVSDSTFNPLATLDLNNKPFIGDYTGADIGGRILAASWTQNRPGFTDGEIFVYIRHLDSLTDGIVTKVQPARFMIESISPNPASTHCTLRISSRIHTKGSIEIRDLRGTIITTIPAEITEGESMIDLPLPPLADGTYFLRLGTATEAVVEKIVIRP